MEANLILEIGSASILIAFTFFFQLFLNLPNGSWSGLLFPSLGLFFVTRIVFHFVYLLTSQINKYANNSTNEDKKDSNIVTKILLIVSKLLPFLMLYMFCRLVLGINPSIAESFQSVYDTVIGDLPAVLLKHSSQDIEKAKTLGSKLLAISFCWFILLFLIETGLTITLHSIAYILRSIPEVWKEIFKPKTILRKKIVKKSDGNESNAADDDKDDN